MRGLSNTHTRTPTRFTHYLPVRPPPSFAPDALVVTPYTPVPGGALRFVGAPCLLPSPPLSFCLTLLVSSRHMGCTMAELEQRGWKKTQVYPIVRMRLFFVLVPKASQERRVSPSIG